MSAHSIFVLDKIGNPLAPTIPARAHKLLSAGVARKQWSKFGTFGIQMLIETRHETPETTLGIDNGTKFEGYAIVCGVENNLAIKLDLPAKKKIVYKLEERRVLRRTRRFRKCRRRPSRSANRTRKGFIAPSQLVIVNSRLKVLRELFHIYPISIVGLEDVCFDHAKHRWGRNFSTIEIGKTKIRNWLSERSKLFEFKGYETKVLRDKYHYPKTHSKSADEFSAHCSDSLALAVEVNTGARVEPGAFIVVDDTYRAIRRKLHDTQPTVGGVRAKYAQGIVQELRKGLLIGTIQGNWGQLCGKSKSVYRYYDISGCRRSSKNLSWISTQFKVRIPTPTASKSPIRKLQRGLSDRTRLASATC